MLDPANILNPRTCGYTLLSNNIEKFMGKKIALPKKITVDLNYIRSEGRIALTLKQSCAKGHKNYALEVTSRLKRPMSNVSKNKTENKLPMKMTRTSPPVQQSISNAVSFFCDWADVFSKQDLTGTPKHINKYLQHRVESFNRHDYVRQAATQMGIQNC